MSGLQLTFLGTATSVGVPMIGCDCETCRSTDPRDKRLRASIYVQTPESSWIVDTGPDFRTQVLREGIRRLDAVLVSHPHMDHLTGFDDVRRFTIPEDAAIPVYAMSSCLDALNRIFFFAFTRENRWRGYLKADACPIEGPFMLGKTEVVPLPVEHGKHETIGFMFVRGGRKLCAYMSDCKIVPPATRDLMRGVDTLICDALRHTPHPTHMNFAEAIALSQDVRPRETWFTHIQCEVMHSREEPKLPPGIRIAYDGLKLQWDD